MFRIRKWVMVVSCLFCISCTVIGVDEFEYDVDPNIGEGNVYPSTDDSDSVDDSSLDSAVLTDSDSASDTMIPSTDTDAGTDTTPLIAFGFFRSSHFRELDMFRKAIGERTESPHS